MNEQSPENKRKNRTSLKKEFGDGSFPTDKAFESLIESTLNLESDGFIRTEADGFKIAQRDDEGKLLSFPYELGDPPLYSFKIDTNRRLRLIGEEPEQDQAVLFVPREDGNAPDGPPLQVGINVLHPDPYAHAEVALDVGGTVRSVGRIGVAEELTAPADGKWHAVTGPLTGVQGYEVIAGVGGVSGQGRYAVSHAVALNTFHPYGLLFNFLKLKRRVRVTTAYYRSRAEKIRVQWYCEKEDRKQKIRPYRLRIRTNGPLGDNGKDDDGNDILIRYYLTKLWFDDMAGARPGAGSASTDAPTEATVNGGRHGR